MERKKPKIRKFGINGVRVRLKDVDIDDPVVDGVVKTLNLLDGVRYTTSEVLVTREPEDEKTRNNLAVAGHALVGGGNQKAKITLYSSRIHEDSRTLNRDPAVMATSYLRHELGHALHFYERAIGFRDDEFERRTGEDLVSDSELEVIADGLFIRLK